MIQNSLVRIRIRSDFSFYNLLKNIKLLLNSPITKWGNLRFYSITGYTPFSSCTSLPVNGGLKTQTIRMSPPS